MAKGTTNPLPIGEMPILHTSDGVAAQGADYYKASINGGPALNGTFKPLEGGVSVSVNNEKIEQQVNGRVRIRVDQNRTASITFSCMYQIGDGSPTTGDQQAEMRQAMGIGRPSGFLNWNLNPGDIWRFTIDQLASDRGNFDPNSESIPFFLSSSLTTPIARDVPLVLETGATMSVPAQGFWQLSLPFMIYIDSDVLQSDPISALTGQLIPR